MTGWQKPAERTHLPRGGCYIGGYGILGLSSFIAELCNGSTYDSDSYCLGSNPSSPAISLHGQAVKTLPSQGKIMGSIPIGGATKQNISFCFFIFQKRLSGRFQHKPERFPSSFHGPAQADSLRRNLLSLPFFGKLPDEFSYRFPSFLY